MRVLFLLTLLLLQLYFSFSLNLFNRMEFKAISGVSVSNNVVRFTKDITESLTVSTLEAFKRSTKINSFSVYLPIKDARTAIGYSFTKPPVSKYMTPDYISGQGYISMGGAGFIYPSKSRASAGYGKGDTVKAEINWNENLVNFYINNVMVGTKSIDSSIDFAYPSISSESGLVECSVSFV